jgi:FKBP-type peptidyl-prolyl cis-trans isomerase FklB
MKKTVILALVALIFASCDTQKQMEKAELKTKEDSLSYAFGISIGDNLKKDSIELDPVMLGKALIDIKEDKGAMTPEEANKTIQDFFEKKEQSKHQVNIDAGEKFLADNLKKEGIETTESGLQYKVIKEGTGEQPDATDQVTVHYEGTLIDGTTFDSSYERGEPATFGLNQVIPGWTEALQLMKEGAVWEIYLPHDLAYGPRQAGQIPPYSTLIFKVELVSIGSEE